MKQVVKNVPDPDEPRARAGMIAPQPVELEMGSYLYRFASSTAMFVYHVGPWWIRQVDFDSIVARATRAGVDLGQKARFDLAVLHKWGNHMDVAVEARVSDKLWAWTGLAKPQLEQTVNGKIIRMFGNPGIRQLYLCGFVTHFQNQDPGDRFAMMTPYGRKALSVTGAKLIPSSSR